MNLARKAEALAARIEAHGVEIEESVALGAEEARRVLAYPVSVVKARASEVSEFGTGLLDRLASAKA